MVKLSVVITAYNEEEKIRECLESVKSLADEIIIVDNSSTDNTAAIAKKYTKKIFTQKNDPLNIDIKKNFGFGKATGEWILSLDADERVTPELAKEIRSVIDRRQSSLEESIVGYWIPRKNIIFGKWMRHTGWYPDYQLRLFRKGKGAYKQTHVHEPLALDGHTAYLQEPMVHEHYKTLHEFVNKSINTYVPNEAEAKLAKGYQFSYLDVVRFPFNEFLGRFFAREGYKDGLHGLVLSLLMASYHLMIFVYIWEKQKFVEETHGEFLDTLRIEARRSFRELMYWFLTEKVSATKNFSRKYILKIQKKFL